LLDATPSNLAKIKRKTALPLHSDAERTQPSLENSVEKNDKRIPHRGNEILLEKLLKVIDLVGKERLLLLVVTKWTLSFQ
jgi:hypothetical protein